MNEFILDKVSKMCNMKYEKGFGVFCFVLFCFWPHVAYNLESKVRKLE